MVEKYTSGGDEDFFTRVVSIERPKPTYQLNAKNRKQTIGRGKNGGSCLDPDFEISYPLMLERRKDLEEDLPKCYDRKSIFGQLELQARRKATSGDPLDLEKLRQMSLDTYTGHAPLVECTDEEGWGVTLDYSRVEIK
jgi:hypothetical protein